MVQEQVRIQKDRLALIGLGANLPSTFGAPLETILAVLAPIQANLGSIVAISRVFQTPAFPKGSGPDFVNAAAAISTDLPPQDILAGLHAIEAEAGRVRDLRWGARTLDLDLLALGDVVLPDEATQKTWMSLPPDRQGKEAPPELILPHPRLQDRAFVLIPLADICPDWRHPATGLTLNHMAAALPEDDKAAICPV
jgi:2-amino-4-hydroxy-6-hydroxymethyldihydropteridine diphosphokinase